MKKTEFSQSEPSAPRRGRGRGRRGFTLIELLTAMSILSIMLLLLSQLLDQIQKTWNYSEGRVSQFREARVAFDLITKSLSQATLNAYWGLEYDENNIIKNFQPVSELHFLTLRGDQIGSTADGQLLGHSVFFQAPLGFSGKYRNLNNLLNARGYYLLFGPDTRYKPRIFNAEPSYRFRIMEYRPPAEENQIYIDGDDERQRDLDPNYTEWFRDRLELYSNPLAENIVAMVISPRDTLEEAGEDGQSTYSRIAPEYTYDSNKHTNPLYLQQLPPLVRVTLVAVDEASAVRLEAEHGQSMPTVVPTDLFRNTGNFESDVEKLSQQLNENGVNHRVFSTMVALRSAKWRTVDPGT